MFFLSNNKTNGKFHENNIVTLYSWDQITNLQNYSYSGKIKLDSFKLASKNVKRNSRLQDNTKPLQQ